MNLRGAIELHRPLDAAEMRPGLLVSAVADDDLGDGRLRYRTQKVIGYHRDGRPIYSVKGSSRQTWQETLAALQVDGPALTGTAAASLLGTATNASAAAKFTLPANFFGPDGVGKVLRVALKGRISNIVTTPGTLTIDVRMGPTSNIIVFNGGAFSLNVVAKTNVTFICDILLTCRAVGPGTLANLMGIGQFQSESVVGAAAGTTVAANLPASAPAVGTGFDSTVAMVVDVFGTFSLTGNSLTVHEYTLESLN